MTRPRRGEGFLLERAAARRHKYAQRMETFLYEEILGNNHIKIEPVGVMERIGSDRKIRFLVPVCHWLREKPDYLQRP